MVPRSHSTDDDVIDQSDHKGGCIQDDKNNTSSYSDTCTLETEANQSKMDKIYYNIFIIYHTETGKERKIISQNLLSCHSSPAFCERM